MGGGAPPANVEITYCWRWAVAKVALHKISAIATRSSLIGLNIVYTHWLLLTGSRRISAGHPVWMGVRVLRVRHWSKSNWGGSGGTPFRPQKFETCPDWGASLDKEPRFPPIILKTLDVHEFDHSANCPAKVRNVSRLGSQIILNPTNFQSVLHFRSEQSDAMQLWLEVDAAVSPYPSGVLPVPKPISGTSFFPGGLGLWLDEPTLNKLTDFRIMIVGQDFNSLKVYQRAFDGATEVDSSPTWRNLLKILGKANIHKSSCFFTNFFMGLRRAPPEKGKFPGAKDGLFTQRCHHFFHRQLAFWQPQVILTLGQPALRGVGAACQVPVPRTLRECDRIYNIPLPHGPTIIAALTHPSLYDANVGRRRYGDFRGEEAEQAMIADAVSAFIPSYPET